MGKERRKGGKEGEMGKMESLGRREKRKEERKSFWLSEGVGKEGEGRREDWRKGRRGGRKRRKGEYRGREKGKKKKRKWGV